MINLSKLKEIHDVINKYFKLIDYIVTGENKPDESILKEFKITKKTDPILERFFKYGKAEMSTNIIIKNKPVEEIGKLIDSAKINSTDEKIVLYLKTSALNGVKSFKDAFSNKVINELNKDDLRNVLIENRDITDTRKLAKKLADVTGDYNINWKRIAHTELWNAKIFGQAASILNGECKGSELREKTYVYKKVESNACKHCKKHYLKENGLPRLFTLEELINNGTNYGKKTEDWKPVLGTMHPNCMCRLVIAATHEAVPNGNLIKSENTFINKRDKSHLKYVKKIINSNGKTYEQGFWVKDQSVDSSKEKKEKDDTNLKEVKGRNIEYDNSPKTDIDDPSTLGPNNKDINIAGLNQYDASDLNKIRTPLPTIEYAASHSKKDVLPEIDIEALPKKKKIYYSAINGFDYNVMLAIKDIFSKKDAITYAKSTGFNIKAENTMKAWNDTLNEVNKYLCINNKYNSKSNLQTILSVIYKFSYKNDGELARCIYELSKGAYPVLGIFNENTEKVLGVVTQIEDKYYDTRGFHTMGFITNQYLKDVDNPMIPFVPLTLKKNLLHKELGNWFFNEIEIQSAHLEESKAKKILREIVKRLLEDQNVE